MQLKTTISISAMTLVVASASAQVILTGPGSYSQNFDTLAPSGLGNSFVNNSPAPLMQGWYSNQISYDADNGSISNAGQYSEGGSNTERALGSVSLQGALIVYGMRLNNASGGTFSALNLAYTGEQWRDGSTSFTDVLSFAYSTNATGLFSGTWNPVSALDFNSVSNVGAGAINGNLAVNESFQSNTMTGLNWANGTDIWVRWLHVGNASRDALALDNVKLNAVAAPEPSGVAVCGMGLVCLAAVRRRGSKGVRG